MYGPSRRIHGSNIELSILTAEEEEKLQQKNGLRRQIDAAARGSPISSTNSIPLLGPSLRQSRTRHAKFYGRQLLSCLNLDTKNGVQCFANWCKLEAKDSLHLP